MSAAPPGRTRTATLHAIGGSFALQLALLASGILAARLLGVEDRGYLALVALLPMLLANFGSGGMPLSATYYLARRPDAQLTLVRSLLPVLLAQAVVLTALQAALFALVFADDPRRVQLACAAALLFVPASIVQQYGLAVLQALGPSITFNVLRVAPAFGYSAAIGALFVAGAASLPAVTLCWSLTALAVAVATGATAWARLDRSAAGEAPRLREVARFGARSLVGAVSPVENFRADQLAVGFLLGPAALGLYAVATSFTNLPKFVAQSIGLVAYPHVARTATAAAALRSLWRFTWLTTLASAVLVAVGIAAVGWLVPFFFGQQFADAVPVARVLLLSAFFLSMRRIVADGARGAGFPVAGTAGEIASWLALVPLLLVLSSRWDVVGAAFAVTAASAFSVLVVVAWIARAGAVAAAREDRYAVTPAPGG